jgi:predicted small secreted protein
VCEMKRLAVVLAVCALLLGGCAGRQVTNRQVATVAIGAGLIAMVITAMVLSASCNNCDNN